MTDYEMATALGDEINRLRCYIDALEGVMLQYRVSGEDGHPHEIPWQHDLIRVQAEPVHQATIRARYERLQVAIAGVRDESDLIQALFKTYCRTQ
jgi:hypothetical protein